MIFHNTIMFDFKVGDKVKVIDKRCVEHTGVVSTITNIDTHFPIELTSGDTFTMRGFYLASEDTDVQTSSHPRRGLYKQLICSNITRLIPI
jgi:hypothetical protein